MVGHMRLALELRKLYLMVGMGKRCQFWDIVSSGITGCFGSLDTLIEVASDRLIMPALVSHAQSQVV